MRLYLPTLALAGTLCVAATSEVADKAELRDTAALRTMLAQHANVNTRNWTAPRLCIGPRIGTIWSPLTC